MSLIEKITAAFTAVSADVKALYQRTRFSVASLDALLADPLPYAVGAVVFARAEGASYEVVTSAPDLQTAGGVKLRLCPGLVIVTPAMFGAVGAPFGAAPADEYARLQRMVNYAMTNGSQVIWPARVYGISQSILVQPQSATPNRSEIVANHPGPRNMMASHYQTLDWLSAGNAQIVPTKAMDHMVLVKNGTFGGASIEPQFCKVEGLRFDGLGLAKCGIEFNWSYRNAIVRCRFNGLKNAIRFNYSSVNVVQHCWTSTSEAGVQFPASGDNKMLHCDINVQTVGVECGSGSNTQITDSLFTGDVYTAPAGTMRAISLFTSPGDGDRFSRDITVKGCEFVGIDVSVYGADNDADGKLEIFRLQLIGNHVIQSPWRPTTMLADISNGYLLQFIGNGCGDVWDSSTMPLAAIKLTDCRAVVISGNTFSNHAGNVVNLIRVVTASVTGNSFYDCGKTINTPHVRLEDTLNASVTGNSVSWLLTTNPAATRFVSEYGSSNRNIAGLNAIDSTKMATAYSIVGAQSVMN